jgi:ATP adenylyltransferase
MNENPQIAEEKTSHAEDEKGLFTHHLLAVGKLKYAQGTRPPVDCIFCAVQQDDPRVEVLKVYEEEQLFICLNLFPYNPGHLMVIPTRHVEKFEELSEQERNRVFQVTLDCQRCLESLYHPTGFNVGYNQGKYAGASIAHVHIHIVPRYKSELGYIDIVGQTRIVVLPVSEVYKTIKREIHQFISIPSK